MTEEHAIPGVVIAVARGDDPPDFLVIGADGLGRPLAADSLFPVASVTKLATALAVLRLADAARLTIEDALGRHAPEAAAAPAGVTLRQLFTHTSGLATTPEDQRAPIEGLAWPVIAQATLRTAPQLSPGTRVDYANPNYSLLAIVVERLTGQPFATALQELVLAPLGIEAYFGVAPARPQVFIADAAAARNAPLGCAAAYPAGSLVTTAAGAIGLVRAFQGHPPDFLSPETRAAATRDQTGGLGGGFASIQYDHCPWGLGPELLGVKRPHWAPPEASPATFGHYGATGCCAWADPRAGVAWTILTTRMPVGMASRAIMTPIGAAILTATER
jgi:CubicO group peptidase (beta-lactamase class C family)